MCDFCRTIVGDAKRKFFFHKTWNGLSQTRFKDVENLLNCSGVILIAYLLNWGLYVMSRKHDLGRYWKSLGMGRTQKYFWVYISKAVRKCCNITRIPSEQAYNLDCVDILVMELSQNTITKAYVRFSAQIPHLYLKYWVKVWHKKGLRFTRT